MLRNMDYITNPYYDWIKVPQNLLELDIEIQDEIYKTWRFFFRRPVTSADDCAWCIREAFMYRFHRDMALYKPPIKVTL